MEEKKERTIEELSLLERLQYVRVEVQRKAKRKSGRGINGAAYYNQKDFLPIANEIFAKYKITPVFVIKGHYEGERYIEVAYLTMYNAIGEGTIEFTTPTANANLPNQIQALGAKHSYLKRYLYLNALELAEADMVEEKAVKDAEQKKANNPYGTTQRMADKLKEYYSDSQIAELCKMYKVSKPIDLPVEIVASYIDQGQKARK